MFDILIRRAQIEHVLVNGQMVIEGGKHTGALAGEVLESPHLPAVLDFSSSLRGACHVHRS